MNCEDFSLTVHHTKTATGRGAGAWRHEFPKSLSKGGLLTSTENFVVGLLLKRPHPEPPANCIWFCECMHAVDTLYGQKSLGHYSRRKLMNSNESLFALVVFSEYLRQLFRVNFCKHYLPPHIIQIVSGILSINKNFLDLVDQVPLLRLNFDCCNDTYV